MKKLFIFCYLFPIFCAAQKTIKIHFLYGSKPKKQYKNEESKWFGGKLGGHVGIETDTNQIYNFCHQGSFHYFSNNADRHSMILNSTKKNFYEIFGGEMDSMKYLIVVIPVSDSIFKLCDSIYKSYEKETPYDYAFIGYRCGASAYDVLAKCGIVKKYGHKKTYRRIFYPRRLRKRIIKLSNENKWKTIVHAGTKRRKWERDVNLIK